MYVPIRVVEVRGHNIPAIEERGTTSMTHFPFSEAFLDRVSSLVSVRGRKFQGQKIDASCLIQTSPFHGRSYEVKVNGKRNVIWEDHYGNLFGSLNTKGNNLKNPYIDKSSTNPSGYMVYGLQETDSIARLVEASEILRAFNVDTEVIERVFEPAELPINGRMVPLPEFKKKLVQAVMKRKTDENPGFTPEDIPAISKFLEATTFYTTVRGHQVEERLQDLLMIPDRKNFKAVLEPILNYVNVEEDIKGRRNPRHEHTLFDINSDVDINVFLSAYLPIRLAKNVACMHALGLVHRYLHVGNISVVGSIYDLDSVKGKLLGDDEVTHEDKMNDVAALLDPSSANSIFGMLIAFQNRQIIQGGEGLAITFIDTLIKTYRQYSLPEQTDYGLDEEFDEEMDSMMYALD